MSRIGFIDDFYDEKEENKKPQEPEYTESQIKTFEQEIAEARKNLYIAPRLIQMMDDSWNAGVVVHDFGDDYHIPEEEKLRRNHFYKQFRKLNNWKRVHKKIDTYILCARDSIACLTAVAESNTVYPVEKFIHLVLNGKLYINGWFFPKYKGRDRKDYDWSYINEFILSDEPLEKLSRKENISEASLMSEEELDELAGELFTEEELEEFIRPMTEEEKYRYEVKPFDPEKDRELLSEKNSTIVLDTTLKESRRLLKEFPELLEIGKEKMRSARSVKNISRYVSDFKSDDMEIIEEYDRRLGYHSDSDLPVFEGVDITKGSKYHRYMRALEQYERTQIKYNDRGSYRTEEEMREISLKEALDAAGWNIRKLYDNQKIENKMKRAMKADKKRERELKRQLTKIQDRVEKRKKGADTSGLPKKKKKKDKKEKKTKKMKKVLKKKTDDFFDGYKDEYESLKEYGKDALDFRM